MKLEQAWTTEQVTVSKQKQKATTQAGWDVAQLVEHLPSTLGVIASTT